MIVKIQSFKFRILDAAESPYVQIFSPKKMILIVLDASCLTVEAMGIVFQPAQRYR